MTRRQLTSRKQLSRTCTRSVMCSLFIADVWILDLAASRWLPRRPHASMDAFSRYPACCKVSLLSFQEPLSCLCAKTRILHPTQRPDQVATADLHPPCKCMRSYDVLSLAISSMTLPSLPCCGLLSTLFQSPMTSNSVPNALDLLFSFPLRSLSASHCSDLWFSMYTSTMFSTCAPYSRLSRPTLPLINSSKWMFCGEPVLSLTMNRIPPLEVERPLPKNFRFLYLRSRLSAASFIRCVSCRASIAIRFMCNQPITIFILSLLSFWRPLIFSDGIVIPGLTLGSLFFSLMGSPVLISGASSSSDKHRGGSSELSLSSKRSSELSSTLLEVDDFTSVDTARDCSGVCRCQNSKPQTFVPTRPSFAFL
jgi:hypothetical protein